MASQFVEFLKKFWSQSRVVSILLITVFGYSAPGVVRFPIKDYNCRPNLGERVTIFLIEFILMLPIALIITGIYLLYIGDLARQIHNIGFLIFDILIDSASLFFTLLIIHAADIVKSRSDVDDRD